MKRAKNSQVKQAAKQFISIYYMKLFVHWDVLTHYSVELLFINVAVGALCHIFSVGEGWQSGLRPRAWVFLEIFE